MNEGISRCVPAWRPSPPEEVAVSVVTVEEMLRGRLAILARRSDGEA